MTTINFSNIKLGKSISKYRKAKNLTQSELAEQLGVSHQAVSSWENGQTCPDISKLGDLSRIFEVSIDTLFENHSIGSIVSKVENEEPLEESEVITIAPLAKPDTLESIIERANPESFKLDTMVALAPFADEADIERWIMHYEGTAHLKSLVPLAPFVSSETILRVIENHVKDEDINVHDLVGLAPFLEEAELDSIIHRILVKGHIKDLVPLAPFASQESLSKLVKLCVEDDTFSIKELSNLASFLSQDDLDRILDKASSGSIQDVTALAPFVSQASLSRFVRKVRKEAAFSMRSLTSLAPFLDRDILKEIIEEAIQDGNLDEVSGLFPFI